MANKVQCSLLDNVIYDFENHNLPKDNINTDVFGFTDGLSWSEQAKLIKYYNLAIKDGNQSVSHLKLVYTVAEIINKYHSNCQWNNKIGFGCYNKNYAKKYYKHLQ